MPRRRPAAVLLALLVALAVAACGGDDDDGSTAAPGTSTTTTGPASTVDPGPTAPPPPAGVEPPPVRTIGRLALEPTGLGERVGTFGDVGDLVLLEVATEMAAVGFGGVQGLPDEDTGFVAEDDPASPCAGQVIRRVRWADLTLVFERDGDVEPFVGWVLDAADPPTGLTTPAGIGLGDAVADVREAYGPDAVDDTGTAFTSSPEAPAIRGTTAGPADTDPVTGLSAGQSCTAAAAGT